jgi:hypothetical protein
MAYANMEKQKKHVRELHSGRLHKINKPPKRHDRELERVIPKPPETLKRKRDLFFDGIKHFFRRKKIA